MCLWETLAFCVLLLDLRYQEKKKTTSQSKTPQWTHEKSSCLRKFTKQVSVWKCMVGIACNSSVSIRLNCMLVFILRDTHTNLIGRLALTMQTAVSYMHFSIILTFARSVFPRLVLHLVLCSGSHNKKMKVLVALCFFLNTTGSMFVRFEWQVTKKMYVKYDVGEQPSFRLNVYRN